MLDSYTEHIVLLAGIEVKKGFERDQLDEAQLQLKTWLASGIRCLQKLRADVSSKSVERSKQRFPLIGWIAAAHKWQMFLAYEENDNIIRIDGPIDVGTTDTYIGVFKLMALVRRVKQYGEEQYWPNLVKEVLDFYNWED